MEFLEPLQILWDYLGMHQEPRKADCIVGFGNFNTDIARRAAELYHQGYAPRILFTGGLGRNTTGLFTEPEAVKFARVAMECGVPEADILLEDRSANTKENIDFMREILQAQGMSNPKIQGVHQPFMERRIVAALGIYWPELDFTVTSPRYAGIGEYLASAREKGMTDNAAISVIVGDFQRIDLYAKLGYQTYQEIPGRCWEAYHRLVAMGYDRQLAR